VREENVAQRRGGHRGRRRRMRDRMVLAATQRVAEGLALENDLV